MRQGRWRGDSEGGGHPWLSDGSEAPQARFKIPVLTSLLLR